MSTTRVLVGLPMHQFFHIERGPQRLEAGVRRLWRGGAHALEVSPWPHACAAPVHSTHVRDALGRQHLETVVGEIDLPEDAKADRLTPLIQ